MADLNTPTTGSAAQSRHLKMKRAPTELPRSKRPRSAKRLETEFPTVLEMLIVSVPLAALVTFVSLLF